MFKHQRKELSISTSASQKRMCLIFSFDGNAHAITYSRHLHTNEAERGYFNFSRKHYEV